uniref:Uncharacterized protein n=1 Tax=Octopus bimaculoides TaxID=37653 RepID=A0A0L8GWM7_OCTBM
MKIDADSIFGLAKTNTEVLTKRESSAVNRAHYSKMLHDKFCLAFRSKTRRSSLERYLCCLQHNGPFLYDCYSETEI